MIYKEVELWIETALIVNIIHQSERLEAIDVSMD